jgi:hypothetical protein
MSKKRVKENGIYSPAFGWHIPFAAGSFGERYPLTPEFVVKWINNEGLPWPKQKSEPPFRPTDGYHRITSLIRAFQDAAHDLKDPARAPLYCSEDLNRELPAPLSRINVILERYRLIPFCPTVQADLRRWQVLWFPSRTGSRSPKAEESGWLHAGEIEVLQQVLTMAAEGTVGYLAACRCGRWYVRRRLDQTFCRSECRTEFRRSSETWKAHRRAYMRRYYRLKVSGKVK